MRKRVTLYALLSILILAVTLTGCKSTGDEFALVSSDLTDYNLNSVDYTLGEFKLEFNEKVAGAKVSLVQGDSKSKIETNVEGNVVTLTGLKLEAKTNYQLVTNIKSSTGNELSTKTDFTTSRSYPEIKDPNETLMQTFYWEMNKGKYKEKYPKESNLWKLLSERSDDLAKIGITSVWVPPANKAHEQQDEGYGTYDLWDLGEFNQVNTVRTKYGTKEELEQTIADLHQEGIKVYYDAVLNHRLGAGYENIGDSILASGQKAETYTKFYPLKGRQKYYSKADEWKWDWKAFDGVDYAANLGNIAPQNFKGKTWDDTFEKDYLLGADVDYQNENVKDELKEWGSWIINDIGFDGFRLDAVKHVDSKFIDEWISSIQENTAKDVFFVGEAWVENTMGLSFYMYDVNNPNLHVFDFPLRKTFETLRNGNLNMSTLSKAGMVNKRKFADKTVTFIDNHDTGRDIVEYKAPINIRKYQAYTYILMREDGLPMVYWKDYYQDGKKVGLDKLLKARRYFAYGPGREVKTNDVNTYSYVRGGLSDVPGTGLVMMISQGTSGDLTTKRIDSGKSNTEFYDITSNVKGTVKTDADGYGDFKVKNSIDEGWSVWVPAN
ncbi:alpha-amylase domain-containing protein [Orenia marismortui]|uniref:alpha-amylase domain-containing protein n=1 Tax=Orenia marismortui TaxID=46469 RepID=UPI0003636926|nr:alpha-amylase domain-containing protein [Orenia marismortui]